MKYKCITGGPISENCYLLIDEKTNQAAVVDPGFLNDALLNEIKKYTVQRILLTHGHFDHIREADRLHEMLCAWAEQAEKLRVGEITQEAYDAWRDHYPQQDTTQKWAGVMSQGLSDMLFGD